MNVFGNKARGRISKRVFQENWARQIFRKTNIFLRRTYVCISRGEKCSFFGKFEAPCFLRTPVLRFALLPYYRRYLHGKNLQYHLMYWWYIDQLINWSIDQSRYIDDQRILKSDWTRAFWPITYEPKFSQIWGFHKKIENYKIFPSRLLPAKSNNRILENPIFASFRKNMNFMSTLSLYVSLISCAITWKANWRKLK